MGRVVSAHTDTSQSTTYEICDAFANDPRVAKRFTVIRYGGADLVRKINNYGMFLFFSNPCWKRNFRKVKTFKLLEKFVL